MSSGDESYDAAVAAFGQALGVLTSYDVSALGDTTLASQIVTLGRLAAMFDAHRLDLLGAFDDRGLAKVDGAPSTQAWLRYRTRIAPGNAGAQVRAARTMRDLPVVRDALASGDITTDHVGVVARLSDDMPLDVLRESQDSLVDVAKAVDAGVMRSASEHLRHALDPEAAVRAEFERVQRRRLHVSTTFDGMLALDGLLDAVSGATLLAALDPLMRPSGPDDVRSAGQRRVDALTQLAQISLASGQLPVRGGEAAHISVLADVGTLAGEPGARGAEIGGVGVVAGETLRRLACDAVLTRIGVADDSVVDVGRATRAVPTGTRKLLVARDGGCVFPGCGRPPAWCDAHHLQHWSAGGPTALENLALLCRWHHTFLHEGGWTLYQHAPGQWTATDPGGRSLQTARPPSPTSRAPT